MAVLAEGGGDQVAVADLNAGVALQRVAAPAGASRDRGQHGLLLLGGNSHLYLSLFWIHSETHSLVPLKNTPFELMLKAGAR